MRSKTKTNHTLWAQFFPRFEQVLGNRPIRLTQCCTQFRSLGVKVLCVFHLHDNVAFTFKWYGNTWNKSFYSQRIWIGYNIELAEWVYSWEFLIGSSRCLPLLWLVGLITLVLICKPTLHRKKKNPTDRKQTALNQELSSCWPERALNWQFIAFIACISVHEWCWSWWESVGDT